MALQGFCIIKSNVEKQKKNGAEALRTLKPVSDWSCAEGGHWTERTNAVSERGKRLERESAEQRKARPAAKRPGTAGRKN